MQSSQARKINARYMGGRHKDKARRWERHCGWLTVGIPTIDCRKVRGGVHVFGCIDDIGNMLTERIVCEQDKLGEPTVLICVNSDFVKAVQEKYSGVYGADVASFQGEADFVKWTKQTLRTINRTAKNAKPVLVVNGISKVGRSRGIYIDRMMLRCIEIAYGFPLTTVIIDWIVPAPKDSRAWALFSDFSGNGAIENGADTVFRIHSSRRNHIKDGDVMLVECSRGNDACWPPDQEIIYTRKGGDDGKST